MRGEGVQIKGFPFFLFLNVPGFKPRLFSILDGPGWCLFVVERLQK
jgi:hypothetical protein